MTLLRVEGRLDDFGTTDRRGGRYVWSPDSRRLTTHLPSSRDDHFAPGVLIAPETAVLTAKRLRLRLAAILNYQVAVAVELVYRINQTSAVKGK